MNYFAQHGEDRWLEANWQRLGLPDRGVFVDVGASEGVIESNTAWLERERGWKGLCVDADPRVIADLRRNRTCTVACCAIGERSGLVPFPLHPNQKLAGLLREEGQIVSIPLMRLDYVCDIHGIQAIDILSVDTEGTELDALRMINLHQFAVRVVFVEWDTIGLPDRRVEIIAQLEQWGYVLETTLGANLVFVPKCN